MPRPEQFLHEKNPKLHTEKPVEHEQKRRKRKGDEKEKTSQKPDEKLAAWMEVLKRTHGHREDPRVMERLKDYYHKQYVIKPEDIPEGYYENQRRLERELGHGDVEITQEQRRQLAEVVVADQESTLDLWFDYLTSLDADAYPMWAKYWSFTNMVKLSSFDKERHTFSKRDKGTVAPFPDLNREALAYVVDAVVKKAAKEHISYADNNPKFQQLINGANFGKLYAYAIEKVTPTEVNELEITEGKWVKYVQGGDHMPLVKSLQGHGTGWCTAGEFTAQAQLSAGNFYVYYSNDKTGKPIIPRAVIRMQENSIAEVRGIAPEQNLDPYISDVVSKKLKDFPDGAAYEKKAADMKRLTVIEEKTKNGQALTKDDLVFLYEIDSEIEGFGYQKDPRIAELRSKRDSNMDAPIVLSCRPDQIAHTQSEITNGTNAYIGSLFPGIFSHDIEHIFISFPELKIRKVELTISGTTKDELKQELKNKRIIISDSVNDMLESKDFSTTQKEERLNLVRVTVADLGFSDAATTDQIYKRAEELGLDLCPAEVGPHYRLILTDQPPNVWVYIGMKQIPDRYGTPRVFGLFQDERGRWLVDYIARRMVEWRPDDCFVFRIRN